MHCCAITLANKQPETVNGSPESIMDRGVKRASKVTGSWADMLADAVEGLDSSKAIRKALRRIERQLDQSELEGALGEAELQSGLLGALDAHYEAETENVVKPVRFHQSPFVYLLEERARAESGGGFASRGIDHAVNFFERLEVLQVPSLADAYEWLDEYSVRHAFWVAGLVKERMLQDVRRELSRQIAKGSDLREFRKFVKARLESAGWTPKNRSHVETVFRTNVMSAYSAGRAKQMRHPTVVKTRPYWRITGVRDNRTRSTHRAVQGWVLRADDPAWLEAYPPFGFNCFHPATKVEGAIAGASRAWYTGKMLELRTAIGRRLSVTPNHPILTTQGLVPAHALRKGDKLICDSGQPWVRDLGLGSERHEHQQPASAEDVFRALSQTLGSSLASTRPDEFHGEAAAFMGQVEVVGSYRQLLLAQHPAVQQQRGQLGFEPSPTSAAGLGESLFGSHGTGSPALRLPGGLQLPSPSGRSHPRPLHPLRLGLCSQLDAREFELPLDGVSGTAAFARELLHRLAGPVVADELVDVLEFDWQGHVYDFASTTGWLLTGGIAASNCRCRVTSRRNATVVHLGSELLRYVPDLGFRSGLPSLPKAA